MIREGFWPHEMQLCIDWYERNTKMSAGPLTPIEFARQMDHLTGARHPSNGSPRTCARVWMAAVNLGYRAHWELEGPHA